MSLARTVIFFAVVVAAIGGLYLLTGHPPAPPPGKVIIDVWHPWASESGEDFRRLVNLFNRSQNHIYVRLLYVPNNLSSNQKLFLSISAGVPPDCTFVDGQQVCEWAAQGAIEPIDALMAKYGIHNDDFWTPCWKQTQFLGKTYALTFCADPNFAFFWNKEIFKKAGVLDQGPPKTIADLDRMSRILTKTDANGRITRIGFFPWNVFGNANSIFTWGWAFGGKFYDEKTGRIVCGEDPNVLRALKWMKSYADKYGFVNISAFAEGFGDQEDTPFLRGQIAMAAGHVSNVKLFKKYAPHLDYGAVSMPYPAYMGYDHSAWMGGWCMAIPRGSRHPEEAFKFMKWLCTNAEAGKSEIKTMGTFPGYIHSPAFAAVKGNPKLEIFYHILKHTRHQRPVMPAQAFFMGALDRAVSDVLNGLATPQEALLRAQHDTQKELDRVMAPFRKRAKAQGQRGASRGKKHRANIAPTSRSE